MQSGIITIEKLVELMSINPRKRFGLPETKDICVFDVNDEYIVNPDEFLSKGRSTPFKGMKVYGKCLMTMCGGNIVWQEEENE